MLPDKTTIGNSESPSKEESRTASTTAMMRPPPPATVIAREPPPPTQPQYHHQEPAVAASTTNGANDLDATTAAKIPSLDATAASSATVSSTDPSSNNFGDSSSLESEHLMRTTISSPTATTAPSLSSAITSSSNDNTTATVDNDNNRSSARLRSKSSPSQRKTPSHSCISRPSSLSSKSRGSSKAHHAYFASSEEESEAELDDSSRASRNNYHQQRHMAGGGLTGISKNSSLRGRGKLAEIATEVSHHSPLHTLHPSRVSLSIPQNHPHHASSAGRKVSSGNNKPIPSIYKTTASSRSHSVPPPPQTVTVAVGKNSSPDGQTTNILPSPGSSSSLHHPLQPSSTMSSTLRSRATAAAAAHVNLPYKALTRKRLRKKRGHKHLPRGLPVFKDPRSCMWTSTHDANAPSEDRYSSLVNVLLRPPKTPRGKRTKKKSENENNKNGISGAANGIGTDVGCSRSGGTCDDSSDDEQTAAERMTQPTTNTNTASLSPSAENNNNNDNNEDNDEEEYEDDDTSLIRLSLWSVIDGHGGGCVATYAAEVMLPHIAASVARALKSEIVDRGVCNVNGQLRDANALDLDGLIRSSDRSRHVGKSQVRQREAGIDVVNPNSIHYRSPFEDSESEGDVGVDHVSRGTQGSTSLHHHHLGSSDGGMRSESESEAESEADRAGVSVGSLLPGRKHPNMNNAESITSSVKISVKTAVSPVTQHAPAGTHSTAEVTSITRAITDSFLAVDEGWINSIDPITTHQTSCVSNGRWNAGACALVVFTVQRLDWCRNSRVVDHEAAHRRESGASGLGFFEDTSHNRDAARRRKLDYAAKKCKSVSSLSTMSSTSSITTEANTTEMFVEESEITETEDDDDDISDIFGPQNRRRRKKGSSHHQYSHTDDPHHPDRSIATPASCECHYYLPHDAMLYTAHVGDCRAVMLGSAPPRTIKVPPDRLKDTKMNLSLDHSDRSEDEQSANSSNTSGSVADEISSSEHDSDSSREEMLEDHQDRTGQFLGTAASSRRGALSGGTNNSPGGTTLGYVRRGTSKRQRRNAEKNSALKPFVPLPPLSNWSSEESESDGSASTTAQHEDRLHLPPVGSIRTTPVGQDVVRGVERVVETRGGGGVGSDLLETEDEEAEEEDEIKEIRSVRSGSPTQMDRPPSPTQLVADLVHPPPLPLSMLMRPIDLTTDHSAYNPAEVTAVLRRCNNAPRAISSASSGGIKRVAGSLAVTRALGDAYLKTPRLSFFPYKRHAPYITARPEVNCRILTKGADRILTLASDGVWERASGDDVLRWVRNYYNARIAGVKEPHHLQYDKNYDIDGEQHADDVDDVLPRRKHVGSGCGGGNGSSGSGRLSTTTNEGEVVLSAGNNNTRNIALGNTTVVGCGGEEDDNITAVHDETGSAANLTSPVGNIMTKQPAEAASVAAAATHGGDEKVEELVVATTSEFKAATTTTADETNTTNVAKVAGTKRKHSVVDETSASSHSVSSTAGSSRGGGGGRGCVGGGGKEGKTAPSSRGGHHHHHHNLRSSSSPSLSLNIPSVSDVIVRKVLNKVRKTRNLSSLRMLMSLPKGRARRSKHDDITASVVDLSGFVS